LHQKLLGKILLQNICKNFFDRTVLWMLDSENGNHPELAYLESDPVCKYRLETTFEATKTSTRLLMFQIFFLRNLARPKEKTIADILEEYNHSYGFPPAGMSRKLQKACAKIYVTKDWANFYKRLGLASPTDEEMTSLLRNCILRSEEKGYHKTRATPKQLLSWRKKADNSIPQDTEAVLNEKEEIFPSFNSFKLFVGGLSKKRKQ